MTFRWTEGQREHGVSLRGDTLEWWTAPDPRNRAAGGGAVEQTVESFLADGPRLRRVPPRIVAKLRAALEGT